MGKSVGARKLASVAAYGGGGLSVLGAGFYGLLSAEAKIARKAIGVTEGEPPDATGWYGRRRPGPALRIALLGDSSAAGYGVHRVEETPGAHLASGIAAGADRRVHLREFAVVGAMSRDLERQVDRTLPINPDLVVILIGANDVTHTVLPAQSVHFLDVAVRRLRDADVAVLVGTCPDLGTVRPIPPPLKQIARLWSRRVAAAQTVAVVNAGGRTVSLGPILGPEFEAAPAILFGPDQFHPSAEGYRSVAAVLVPSCLAALGLAPDGDEPTQSALGEGVLPVNRAAAKAARRAGTEVDGTDVGGDSRGLLGRWAQLRHRRRRPDAEIETPAELELVDERAELELVDEAEKS